VRRQQRFVRHNRERVFFGEADDRLEQTAQLKSCVIGVNAIGTWIKRTIVAAIVIGGFKVALIEIFDNAANGFDTFDHG